MRLFWKVFAVLWLATLLVGGSGFLVSRALQQDWLLLQLNPELRAFAAQLATVYEQSGPSAAQQWLERQRSEHRLRARLFDAAGDSLLPGTLSRRPRLQAESHVDGPFQSMKLLVYTVLVMRNYERFRRLSASLANDCRVLCFHGIRVP